MGNIFKIEQSNHNTNDIKEIYAIKLEKLKNTHIVSINPKVNNKKWKCNKKVAIYNNSLYWLENHQY